MRYPKTLEDNTPFWLRYAKHVLAYYSALKKPLISFDFPGTKLYIASGLRSIVSVVRLFIFFSLTLILLAVQLRDGRFCTAALDSRLPSRSSFHCL